MIRPLQDRKILPLPHGKQMAFVVGSGRCGFKSMNVLLNKFQEGVFADYEFRRIAWSDPKQWGMYHTFIRVYGLLSLHGDVDLVVSIAHYFLPYVWTIMEMYPETKFLCLQRSKELTVPSLVKQAKTRNFWTVYGSEHWLPTDTGGKFYKTFPSFEAPRAEAAALYYDYYYETARDLEEKLPNNFHIHHVPVVFDDIHIQLEALEFLGVKDPRMKPGIWKK
jgi:hypothetical protein